MEKLLIAKSKPLANGEGFYISDGPHRVGDVTVYRIGSVGGNNIEKTNLFTGSVKIDN